MRDANGTRINQKAPLRIKPCAAENTEKNAFDTQSSIKPSRVRFDSKDAVKSQHETRSASLSRRSIQFLEQLVGLVESPHLLG